MSGILDKIFKDQIPPEGGRSYSISSNGDGTSNIKDVTQYLQEGSPWGAKEINELISAIKSIQDTLFKPGQWIFAPYRLTYDESVNANRHPWVNYDDDLDKTVYAALYAAIGDTMSDGAAEGMFNCKKLADRFPLVLWC